MKHTINTVFFVAVFVLLTIASFYYDVHWWLFPLPPLLWFIIAATGSGLVQSGYHIKTYYHNPKVTARQVAISFDDGPTPETLKVLDLLKQYDAKATFFCIGRQIEKYPEIFKRVVSEGHTIGNHTYSHPPTFALLSADKIGDELRITNALIEKNSGVKAKFFRPPYGVTSPAMAKAIRAGGYDAIGWNIRSLDAVIKSEQKIFNRIKRRLKPGSIILLHDTSQKSVNVLEQLLVLLQQNNYEAVTIGRLLNIPAYEE